MFCQASITTTFRGQDKRPHPIRVRPLPAVTSLAIAVNAVANCLLVGVITPRLTEPFCGQLRYLPTAGISIISGMSSLICHQVALDVNPLLCYKEAS